MHFLLEMKMNYANPIVTKGMYIYNYSKKHLQGPPTASYIFVEKKAGICYIKQRKSTHSKVDAPEKGLYGH